MSKGTLSAVVVVTALVVGAGCKGSEEQKADTPPPPPAAASAVTTAAAAATGEIASYPTEVAMGGTVMTQQNIKVYQAADPASTLLTTLGPNTLVETKARYGDWTRINWPSGVGKLSPGWVQSSYLLPPKTTIVDAGIGDSGSAPPADAAPPPVVDAGVIPVPPTPDAGPTRPTVDAGVKVRPKIVLPTKK